MLRHVSATSCTPGASAPPDRGYVLFVTSTYRHPSEAGSTGGTISNYLLMEKIAEQRSAVILHLAQSGESAWDFEGGRARVYREVRPKWRGLQLSRRWIPFVHATTSAFVGRHGAPQAVLATTDTVCALGAGVLRKTPSAIIVRAFENFGLRPPKVTWGTRCALAKQAAVRRFSDGRYLRGANLIATNSAFMAGCIGSRFGIARDRIVVIPQLCDVVPISDPSPGSASAIGFVNRNSDKNLGFVLELAQRLKNRHFVVFGSVPEVARRAPPNVEFRGWESDRNRMFAQAGLWIMPSAWPEPFGRVSIEAQAANRRVLVADVGGLPETVADRRYLIAGYDPERWAKRIEELMSMPEEEVAANGARTRERFSGGAHDRAIDDLVNRLLVEETSVGL